MQKSLLFAVLLLLSTCATPLSLQDDRQFYRVEVISNFDGDTFRANLPLPFSIQVNNQSYRLAFIDAPERWDSGGLAAKLALDSMLHAGPVWVSFVKAQDKFGRAVVWVWNQEPFCNDAKTINQMLIDGGWASYAEY